MTTISTKIMPPILEYSYPSFPYNQASYDFIIKNSVMNDYEDFDYIEIRCIQADSNDEGFNKNNINIKKLNQEEFYVKLLKTANDFGIFKKTYTDIKNINDSQVTISLIPYNLGAASVDLGTGSIFNIYDSGTTPAPRNFKIQCRLGASTTDEVSEWSNASILRVNTGINVDILQKDATTSGNEINVTQTSILWVGRYSAEKDSNAEELVNQYKFTLSRKGVILEDSDYITVGAYEEPNYQYRFITPLENTIEDGVEYPYSLNFIIETNFGYVGTATKLVHVKVPYQRAYDIFTVSTNDQDAYNSININADERFVRVTPKTILESSNYIKDAMVDSYFLKDSAMKVFEPDATHTHLRIIPLTDTTTTSGKLLPDYNYNEDKKEYSSKFQTSKDDSVSIILAITKVKTYSSRAEALKANNLLFRINSSNSKLIIKADNSKVINNETSENAIDICVGAVKENENNQYLIISESLYGLKNYYTLGLTFGDLNELFLVLKKEKGNKDLYFEAITGTSDSNSKWIVNNFTS